MANNQHDKFLADARRYLDLAETARAAGRMGNAIECAWKAESQARDLAHELDGYARSLERERAALDQAKRAGGGGKPA